MFSLIYSFKVKHGYEKKFIKSWNKLTKYIYKYEGILGSRLHKATDGLFIGYAQWTDLLIWDRSCMKLPNEANKVKLEMRSFCVEIKTLYELMVIDDLLINE